MNLTPAQQRVYNDMVNAPMYDGSQQWCDTHKRCDGLINGNWNTNTLKAMERKGVIRIVEIGGWWNDTVELLG
jgi:hypothetical protein